MGMECHVALKRSCSFAGEYCSTLSQFINLSNTACPWPYTPVLDAPTFLCTMSTLCCSCSPFPDHGVHRHKKTKASTAIIAITLQAGQSAEYRYRK